jgi:hypothetical protein
MQKAKEARPKSQYDLSLRPKLKKSDKLKSLSLPHIQTVRPVESAGSSSNSAKSIEVKAFDSPRVPIKYKTDDQINAINKKIEAITLSHGLRRLEMRNVNNKKVIYL